MTETASSAARGTSVFMIQAAVTGILRVLNLAILTRLLLQSDMGQIGFLGIIYGFMQFLGAVGLNHAAPLVVPEEEGKGPSGAVRSFLKRSASIILISSSVMVILVFLLAPFLFTISSVPESLIHLALIIGPFSAMETFLDSFLLARYYVRSLALGRILFDISRVVGTVGLVLGGFGVGGVMLGWLGGELVAVLVFGAAATRNLEPSPTTIRMGPVLAFAVPNLAFQTIDVVIQSTDRLILLNLMGLTTLGVFDVFLRILYMFSLVSLTIATSIYPILTRIRIRLEEKDDSGIAMGSVVVALVRYIIILLLPVAIVVALNSFTVLEVLFGYPYAIFPDASLSFSLLVLIYTLWGVVYAIHTALRSMGEAKFFVVLGVFIILFEIVGCWYLTSLFGLLGSALTRCIYVTLLFAVSWGRLKQRGLRGLSATVVSLGRVGLASAIGGLLVFFAAPSGIIELGLCLIMAILVYIPLLFLFREIKEIDFQLARAVLPTSVHGLVARVERIYFRKSEY
ncbi:MAG: lipopolysaccharide biosynthesis protein [Candidatus Thorarchaeota archaeon]|nr:lipopolysaccharide biosynthesis protein [Candidatus Thorarchaeota archaeon]